MTSNLEVWVRIGTYFSRSPSVDVAIERARVVANVGLDSVFVGQTLSWDALTLAMLMAREVPDLEVGTAVAHTYPRHPITLASQALTAAAATGNRLTLGVGPSHRPVIESAFGMAFDRPLQHTRDYLSILMPLLRGEPVDHHGPLLSATATIDAPSVAGPPVLLSALGPQMLRLAGEMADGTVTTWASAQAIATDIVPQVTKAATAAGRPKPRVAAIVMVAVTGDPEQVRLDVAERFGAASNLPSYRALLDRQGLAGVHETVLVGDEDAVAAGIRSYAEAGATDLLASILGDAEQYARTLDALAAFHSADRQH